MSVQCEFCSTSLKDTKVLRKHQKTTLYCLEKQKEKLNLKCVCSISFLSQGELEAHKIFCVLELKRQIDELKDINESQKTQIIELTTSLEVTKNQLNKYYQSLEEIAKINSENEVKVDNLSPIPPYISNPEEDDDFAYQCELCDSSFISINQLEQHQKTNCLEEKGVKKSKQKIPAAVRRIVWNDYIGQKFGIGKCFCCRKADIVQISFHCGHVISEKEGGTMKVSNLRPICSNCNASMGTKNMIDFMKHFA